MKHRTKAQEFSGRFSGGLYCASVWLAAGLVVAFPCRAEANRIEAELDRAAAAIRAQEKNLISLAEHIGEIEAEEVARRRDLAPRLAESENLLKFFIAAPAAPPFWRGDLPELATGAALTGGVIRTVRPVLTALLAEKARADALHAQAQTETQAALTARQQLAHAYGRLKTMLANRPGRPGRPRRESPASPASDAISLEALLEALSREKPAPRRRGRTSGPQIQAPVAGVKRRDFGQKNNALVGENHTGLSWEGLESGLITAPVAGEVLYAGPFRLYRQILILDAGKGYHILLAGLGKIIAQAGMQVEPGAPVAWLDENEARLYMELRYLGQPVDPAPFMGAGFSP